MQLGDNKEINRVGMLIEQTINDQTWGNKGYRGLLEIQDDLDMEVFFRESVATQQQVNRAVEEFANQGVQLIIGHSSIYGEFFHNIQASYPDIHFLYVNGAYSDENLTSLNFNSLAMGYFAGMLAAEMTESNRVGLIAAYEWQPEVEGFYEGVKYINDNIDVDIQYVYSWNESELAMEYYHNMAESGVDVIYPTGDVYSVPVIEAAQSDQIFSIGYVNDQQPIGGQSVLTSTVQHVDKLYVYAVEQISNGDLEGGIYNFGFAEEVITMGPFSDKVPSHIQEDIQKNIDNYMETGLLPYQLNETSQP
ncbi:BMP family ABC transporter substrate-binding protein [Gracilibacillus oryzae]|uniref:BMP family ABC transporter substrate-binding protein n=2 Tax=Gracilibacillus oryzae TaxID=1672701 RepID=A0A7C8KSR1_9BACI|nr:BMP family ABC transporter substrate-binding protein [Gracilibacillus oryzae]